MSSRDDHLALIQELDQWLEHIHYEYIKDDIPDSEDAVEIDLSSIYVSNVPDHLRKQFTIICRAFSELKETRIRLVFRGIPMTMQARPNIWQLLIGKREYLIFINNKKEKNGIVLEDIPFNGQVGVISHEMCHILDYHNKSIWQIIKTGIMYLIPKKKEGYEKSTDYLAVKKGFGLQLHTWSNYILDDSAISPKYRKLKERFYLTPDFIKSLL
ncbi:MAG: hypothetical protein ACJA01_004080 [Saprospiraceae bacterium]|jgi:hypothetical protein